MKFTVSKLESPYFVFIVGISYRSLVPLAQPERPFLCLQTWPRVPSASLILFLLPHTSSRVHPPPSLLNLFQSFPSHEIYSLFPASHSVPSHATGHSHFLGAGQSSTPHQTTKPPNLRPLSLVSSPSINYHQPRLHQPTSLRGLSFVNYAPITPPIS